MAYDSIDNHLKIIREFDKAAIPMGMYLAWSLNLGLLESGSLSDHEQLVLRVKMQDAKGSELLMAVGGGLDESLFNERGKDFTKNYYPQYLDDYRRSFGRDLYEVEDTWGNYDKISRVLTRELLGSKKLSRYLIRGARKGSGRFLNIWRAFRK